MFARVDYRKELRVNWILGKLALGLVGPLKIQKWIGVVVYKLMLPP